MPEGRDIPYALSLYNRLLDAVEVNNVPLREIRVCGKYNLWDVWAPLALPDDCVRFSAQKTFESVRSRYDDARSGRFYDRSFPIGLFLWGATSLSLLWLFVTRRNVLIFSVDKNSASQYFVDFRIEKIYRVLAKKNIRYVEFFHTLVKLQSIARLWRRGRLSLYLEGIDWLYFFLRELKRFFFGRGSPPRITGLDVFNNEEKQFIHALVLKYVSMAPLIQFRIQILRAALKVSAVKIIVGIDDARYYHELAAVARELDIPFYAFQHGAGHYSDFHVGWRKDMRLRGERMRPKYLVVWNEYWRKELLEIGSLWTEEEMQIGGRAKSEKPGELQWEKGKRTVLIPFETEMPPELLQGVIQKLVDSRIRVLYKTRSDMSKEEQVRILGRAISLVEIVESVEESLGAVLAAHSTMLYDAIEAGVPAGRLESPISFLKRLSDTGLASLISNTNVGEDVENLLLVSEEEIARRKETVRIEVSFETEFEHILQSVLK